MKISDAQTVKVAASSRASRRSHQTSQGIVTEVTLKFFFSLVIGIAGVASLVRLIPYHHTQLAKLREIRAQVTETEAKVFKLRQEFQRNFDPQQTQSLIEKYSSLTTPNRVRVFMYDDQDLIIPHSKIVSNSAEN